MKHLMFDVDGTLVQSYEFDERLFVESVHEVTGLNVISNWETYPHVTDRGILQTFIERQCPDFTLSHLEALVKPLFVSKIKTYLQSHPAQAVGGAVAFIQHLRKREDIALSIATGGWGETARAKLESAGFSLAGIPLVSSNEHHARANIMQMAISQVSPESGMKLTYFGDAEWDKRACKEMGVNLVIVGDRVKHNQMIADFEDVEQALGYAGAI